MTSQTSPDLTDPTRQLLTEILGTVHQIQRQLATTNPPTPPPAQLLPPELAQLPAQIPALSRQLAALLARSAPRPRASPLPWLIPLSALVLLIVLILLRPVLFLPPPLKQSLRLGQHLERTISSEQRDEILRLLDDR